MSDDTEHEWVPVRSLNDVRPGGVVRWGSTGTAEHLVGELAVVERAVYLDGPARSVMFEHETNGTWSVRRPKAKPAEATGHKFRVGQVYRGFINGASCGGPCEFEVRKLDNTPGDPGAHVRCSHGLLWEFGAHWPATLVRDVEPEAPRPGQLFEVKPEDLGDALRRTMAEADAGWKTTQDIRKGDMVKVVGPGVVSKADARAVCAPGCNPGKPCMGPVCMGHEEKLMFMGRKAQKVPGGDLAVFLDRPAMNYPDPGRVPTADDYWRARNARLAADRTRGPVLATWRTGGVR